MSIRRRIKVESRDRKEVLSEAIISLEDFYEEFFARPRQFQWFFGAGMSASAGVPLSEQIVDEIVVKVFEKSNPAKRGQVQADELKEWVSREKWFNPNFAYISALEKEYPSTYLRTELFKRYMRGRFPTPAQLLYAIGVKEDKLSNRCYTTNWDTLNEDAFYWLRGTNCITIKGPDQLREVKDTEHRYVVKVHGDYDRYDVRYLREGMAKHNDDLRDFLAKSLANTGLVVLGYSGLEYSVMNMLMEIVHDHEEVLNGGLYWGYMGNIKQIPEAITDLMAIGMEKGKKFRIFETCEADFLFERISKKLNLTSLQTELDVAFFRFNKMGYGDLRGRLAPLDIKLESLVHRDLLDEGFLVRDYNAIHEIWKQDTKGFMRKKEEKERASRDAERKLINHCFNDLKHENYADAEVKLKDVMGHFPDNEHTYWGLGWAQYRTGRYDEALASYDEVLRRNPKNWGAVIAKVMCYSARNQWDDVVKLYDQVLELKGEMDSIWYNRGLAAHKNGNLQAELDSYETATGLNGGNYRAWYNLGLCHYEQGNLLTAIKCFDKAHEVNGRLFEAVYNAGVLKGKMGQDTQAISLFDKCIELNQEDDLSFRSRGIAELMTGRNEASVESYEEYLAGGHDDDESWANIGYALYGCERLSEAMEYTQRYLDRNPEDARVWYNKGLILYRMGKRDEAMEAFNRSLKINDDYDMVWYRKALLLGEMEQYEGEIEFLTRFLNTNEQDLRGWFELGEANFKLGEAATDEAKRLRYFTAAVNAYDRALDVQRTDVRTWLHKAICLNQLHRYEEALECVKYLERYDKENAEVWFQKGLALDGLGDQLAAVDTLAQALKLDGDHEGAFYRRGLLLAELEQFAKAVDHFDNVLRVNPKEWRAYHFKGVCIINQKEYERALTVFKAGQEKFPQVARFLIDQALAKVMMRNIDEARALIKQAMTLDPSLTEEINSTPEFAGLN